MPSTYEVYDYCSPAFKAKQNYKIKKMPNTDKQNITNKRCYMSPAVESIPSIKCWNEKHALLCKDIKKKK